MINCSKSPPGCLAHEVCPPSRRDRLWPPTDLHVEHRRPSAGDVPQEGTLKPEKRGIRRVCVKASPAFSRRRLRTKTDYIDCPTLFLFLFIFFLSFLFYCHLRWSERPNKIGRSRNWPKSKLAEVEIGRSRPRPNNTQHNTMNNIDSDFGQTDFGPNWSFSLLGAPNGGGNTASVTRMCLRFSKH